MCKSGSGRISNTESGYILIFTVFISVRHYTGILAKDKALTLSYALLFSYAGPHAWNSLPEHLQQTTSIELFKRSLKTFLFGQLSRSAH